MRRWHFVIFVFLSWFLVHPSLCLAQTKSTSPVVKTYTVSIVPQYSAVQLYTDWSPVIARLSRDSGISFRLVVAKTIPKFESGLLAAEPDFAFANPYHAVMAKRAHGYLPILRDAKPLKGILLVRNDSPIKTINELASKDVGFPAPNSFGASLYMRALLASDQVPIHPQFLTTHANVYRSILNGTVMAGGGVNTTLNDEPVEVRSQLRVLYQTPETPSHPLVVHPRVPEDVVNSLKKAFVGMQKDAEGQRLLAAVRFSQPLQADYQHDYLPLEKLKIEKFVILDRE